MAFAAKISPRLSALTYYGILILLLRGPEGTEFRHAPTGRTVGAAFSQGLHLRDSTDELNGDGLPVHCQLHARKQAGVALFPKPFFSGLGFSARSLES